MRGGATSNILVLDAEYERNIIKWFLPNCEARRVLKTGKERGEGGLMIRGENNCFP